MYSLEVFDKEGNLKKVTHDTEGLWQYTTGTQKVQEPAALFKRLSEDGVRMKRTSPVLCFTEDGVNVILNTENSIYCLTKEKEERERTH